MRRQPDVPSARSFICLRPASRLLRRRLKRASASSSSRRTRSCSSRAGLLGLGARFEQLTLTDAQGAPVQLRQLAPGEYEAARPAQDFHYEVKLDPPELDAAAAHVSWLTTERGILMLGDLLPLPVGRAKLQLTLPAGWQSVALAKPAANGHYEFAQAESGVIFIGRELRQQQARAGATEFTLAQNGPHAQVVDPFCCLGQLGSLACDPLARLISQSPKDGCPPSSEGGGTPGSGRRSWK